MAGHSKGAHRQYILTKHRSSMRFYEVFILWYHAGQRSHFGTSHLLETKSLTFGMVSNQECSPLAVTDGQALVIPPPQ